MKDISSSCNQQQAFLPSGENNKDMDTNVRKLVDDSMNDPGTFTI